MTLRPLTYARRLGKNGWAVAGIVFPFGALAMSVAVAVYGFARMDAERLLWEGGHGYFRERFPLGTVLALAGVGFTSGMACAVVVRRHRGIALLAVTCNALWAAWWARHLFR